MQVWYPYDLQPASLLSSSSSLVGTHPFELFSKEPELLFTYILRLLVYFYHIYFYIFIFCPFISIKSLKRGKYVGNAGVRTALTDTVCFCKLTEQKETTFSGCLVSTEKALKIPDTRMCSQQTEPLSPCRTTISLTH